MKQTLLVCLLLFAFLMRVAAASADASPASAAAPAPPSVNSAVTSDPYTGFAPYLNYMQGFYLPSQGCFRTYPIEQASGGDYYNCYYDDAGKLLTAFTLLNDEPYAQHAATFIIDNAIYEGGYPYLPQRVQNTPFTYIHTCPKPTAPGTACAGPQAAPDTYNLTFDPVVSPNLLYTNSTTPPTPAYWQTYASGSSTLEQVQNTISAPGYNGSNYVYASVDSAGGNAELVQRLADYGYTILYAYYNSSTTINGGVLGDANPFNAQQTYSAAETTGNLIWTYVSYPAFTAPAVIPANSEFIFNTWLSANRTQGATYGVQVNEVCGYMTSSSPSGSSPWGGEYTSSITLSTTPAEYTATVPTGSTAVTVPAGCGLKFIVYVNPGSSTAVTITVSYNSINTPTNAEYPNGFATGKTWFTPTMTMYAHNNPATAATGTNAIGNYTVGFTPETYSAAETTGNLVYTYLSYPAFSAPLIIPANSEFTFNTWLSASQTQGATYGVQVNEICGGFGSSPWGGEYTSSVTLSTTSTEYTATVPTGSAPVTIPAGCSLKFIVYVNPGSSTAVTITVSYGSEKYRTDASFPFVPTIGMLYNSPSSLGFALKQTISNLYGDYGDYGAYYGVVTTVGTVLFTEPGVSVSAIKGLVAPVTVIPFSQTQGGWVLVTHDAVAVFNSAGFKKAVDGGAPLEAVVMGVSAASTATAPYTADLGEAYIADYVGLGNIPVIPGLTAVGGYYYVSNGLTGFTNMSAIIGNHTNSYAQPLAFGDLAGNEYGNALQYKDNSSVIQMLNAGPWISGLFLWDAETNAATGYMWRQFFPYSEGIGSSVPYRLYVGGTNGSAVTLDYWVNVDPLKNVFAWVNVTLQPGQDYLEPRLGLSNYGPAPVQVGFLSLGLGTLKIFEPYQPWWTWTALANNTTTFLPVSSNANESHYYYGVGYGIYNYSSTVHPTALLFSGYKLPEFANGLLISFPNSTDVEGINYVNHFYGDSLRFVMNVNAAVSPGGHTIPLVFQIVPLGRTMWTDPSYLLEYVLPYALNHKGVDPSMPATWGFDVYGLALYALKYDNSTAYNFALKLWNQNYDTHEEVVQRLVPSTTYDLLHQPIEYWRSLLSYTLAGLYLQPQNATVVGFAERVARVIQQEMTAYGWPHALENTGWAADLLSYLAADPMVAQAQQTSFGDTAQSIINSIQANTTYVPHTVSSWPVHVDTYNEFTPSIWDMNISDQPNPGQFANSPPTVFKGSEMSYGFMAAATTDPALLSAWHNTAVITAFSLIRELTDQAANPLGSTNKGFAVYMDNTGSSNTETQPLGIMSQAMWMQAQYEATGGTFLANITNGGLRSVAWLPNPNPKSYNYFIVGLSTPPTGTATVVVHVNVSAQNDILVQDNGVSVMWDYNTASHDVIVPNVKGTVEIGLCLAGSFGKSTPCTNCVSGSYASSLLGQLEYGCLIHTFVDAYTGSTAPEWAVGVLVGAMLGMVYLETRNPWIPLILMILLGSAFGFLLPSQMLALATLLVALGVAGILYSVFTGKRR
ncbi:MAG: hypothetical protein M1357_03215 [Candidatus Marsarchaeota archaeon]|nr:hypothetical protein [Candidatus Marsarchaeota archaeon]